MVNKKEFDAKLKLCDYLHTNYPFKDEVTKGLILNKLMDLLNLSLDEAERLVTQYKKEKNSIKRN